MSAQLILPHWLVDQMVAEDNLDAFAHAEEMTASMATYAALGRNAQPWPAPVATWREHEFGWEVRID